MFIPMSKVFPVYSVVFPSLTSLSSATSQLSEAQEQCARASVQHRENHDGANESSEGATQARLECEALRQTLAALEAQQVGVREERDAAIAHAASLQQELERVVAMLRREQETNAREATQKVGTVPR